MHIETSLFHSPPRRLKFRAPLISAESKSSFPKRVGFLASSVSRGNLQDSSTPSTASKRLRETAKQQLKEDKVEEDEGEEEAEDLVKEDPSPKRARKSKDSQTPHLPSAPGVTFTTPPHVRKSSRLEAGPSPWCQSERAHGCLDPRVLKFSLDYGYPGVDQPISCNPWHTLNKKIVEEIVKRNTSFFARKNAALAGVQFVYTDTEGVQVSKIFDFNILFVSGGMRIVEVLNLDAPSLNGQKLAAKSIYDILAPKDGEARITKQMRSRLAELYEDANGTKLSNDTFAARKHEVDYLYVSPPRADEKRTRKRPNSAFERDHLHSEQGFNALLRDQPEVLEYSLESLPDGAVIHQMTIHLASLKQMCRRCGAAFFRTSEGAGRLKANLAEYITRFPKKGFQIQESGLQISTLVSGLRVFDNVNLEHRQKQCAKAYEPISNISSFNPHVAQQCLSAQLPRKFRHVLQTGQVKDSAVVKLSFDDIDDNNDDD